MRADVSVKTSASTLSTPASRQRGRKEVAFEADSDSGEDQVGLLQPYPLLTPPS